MANTFTWLQRGHFPVFIGVCFDEKSFQRELGKQGQALPSGKYIPTPGGAITWTYDGSFGRHDNDAAIMCFDLDTLAEADWPVFVEQIAHEVTHVKQHVYDMVGERKPGWESEAYMVGGLARLVTELYLKHTKRK